MGRRRTLRGLDWLSFFLADVQTGVGPFVAVNLAASGWDNASIGMALTAGGLASVLSQVPFGAWVDGSRRTRALAAAAIVVTAGSAFVLAQTAAFSAVVGMQVLHGLATSVLGPAVVALSLGVVGHGALGARLGRNRSFDSAGNLAAAAVMGILGATFSARTVFWVTAVLAAPALSALACISPRDVDRAAARGASAPSVSPVPLRMLLEDRRLLSFIGCAVLFHFANAAMLPILATVLARGRERESSLVLSACIMITQFVVLLLAPWCGRQAERVGRKPVLLLGFGALPVRGVLYTLTLNPVLLVAIQVLDGVAAAVFGTVSVLVVADMTHGTGRFNLAQGAMGAAVGVGAALSTAVGGYVAGRFGPSAAFLALSALAAAAFGWLLAGVPETRLPAHQGADDLRAIKRDRLGGVFGSQFVHRKVLSAPDRARGPRPSEPPPPRSNPSRWMGLAGARRQGAPHGACAAPANTRTSRGASVAAGAYATSVMAMRSAACRGPQSGGLPRTQLHSRDCLPARTHRRRVGHAAVSPWPPTSRRMSTTRSPAPKRNSARAIAAAPKCRRRITPRGTTTTTASHRRHRYRRTGITRITAGVPTALGPRTCRSRRPWPTIPSGRPTGRPAPSQHGQRAGRAS